MHTVFNDSWFEIGSSKTIIKFFAVVALALFLATAALSLIQEQTKKPVEPTLPALAKVTYILKG